MPFFYLFSVYKTLFLSLYKTSCRDFFYIKRTLGPNPKTTEVDGNTPIDLSELGPGCF